MKLKPGDWALIGFFLALSLVLLLLLPGGGEPQAEVYQNGKLVAVYDLKESGRLELGGEYRNVITVDKGAVGYEWSDCPDKTCVHAGFISRPGQSAACVPNRTLVKITGVKGVDAVAGGS